MKNNIVKLLSGALAETNCQMETADIERAIEIPPQENLGDYAFPCFALSKMLRKNPAQIAAELAQTLTQNGRLQKHAVSVQTAGAYLNFFVDKLQLAKETLALAGEESFGRANFGERVVVEFASPNTNKPLHLGHLRNMSIGDSVARLLAFCGCKVFKTSINNDRGVHICKSMLAYKLHGNGETPQSAGVKSDRFVGDYYVKFNTCAKEDESLNEAAQKMLRDWEDGDAETVALWKKMNTWAFDGFRETYKLFGIFFDKEYYESDIYKFGKEIVYGGLEKGIFEKREDGAIFVDLEKEKLGTKVLLRGDGTSVYIVQDLHLALAKDKEFSYDKSYYVVGNEQDHHFAQLIAIFKKLNEPVAEKIKHLSYGMVELPEGKMKSREGTVVDADDLIKETAKLASTEIAARQGESPSLTDEQLSERAKKIALAAIKYQLLKIDITKNMIFDPKNAISFEGDTGPYLLYAYARASSIIRKAGGAENKTGAVPQLEPAEIKLVKKIAFLPEAVTFACERLSPSVVANYAFELAQTFNEFYHAHSVIGSGGNVELFRVNLTNAFRATLKKCLHLLGIEEIETM